MWTKGKRRKGVDCAHFIRNLSNDHSVRKMAVLAGVNEKTIRRYIEGKNYSDVTTLYKIIDGIFPLNEHSSLFYSSDMVLDGNTRVGGVGEFTLKSARGLR